MPGGAQYPGGWCVFTGGGWYLSAHLHKSCSGRRVAAGWGNLGWWGAWELSVIVTARTSVTPNGETAVILGIRAFLLGFISASAGEGQFWWIASMSQGTLQCFSLKFRLDATAASDKIRVDVSSQDRVVDCSTEMAVFLRRDAIDSKKPGVWRSTDFFYHPSPEERNCYSRTPPLAPALTGSDHESI